MDITLLLVGSVIGFAISYILQKLSYKDEYYKKIIDKRLIAYEKAENILMQMRIWKSHAPDKYYHSFFEDWEKFKSFDAEVATVIQNALWLSPKILREFVGLVALDHFAYRQHPESSALVGVQYFAEYSKTCKQIEATFYDDYENFHKVKVFIKDRRTLKGFLEKE